MAHEPHTHRQASDDDPIPLHRDSCDTQTVTDSIGIDSIEHIQASSSNLLRRAHRFMRCPHSLGEFKAAL